MGGEGRPSRGSTDRQGTRARRTTQSRMGALFFLEPWRPNRQMDSSLRVILTQAPTKSVMLLPTHCRQQFISGAPLKRRLRFKPEHPPTHEPTHSQSSEEHSVNANNSEHRATECEGTRGGKELEREAGFRVAEIPPLGLVPRSRPGESSCQSTGFSRSQMACARPHAKPMSIKQPSGGRPTDTAAKAMPPNVRHAQGETSATRYADDFHLEPKLATRWTKKCQLQAHI